MAVSQTRRGRDIRLGQRCRNLGSIEILRGDGKDGSPKNSEPGRSRHKGLPLLGGKVYTMRSVPACFWNS